jgi:hypothetical protein
MIRRTFFRSTTVHSTAMLPRRLLRDRALLGVLLSGGVIVGVYLATGFGAGHSAAARHLTDTPWYCEVYDPGARSLVARSVETFHRGGRLEGLTRLEDRAANRVLLEFSYEGVWQFDDPWLTEAINDYQYLHVDHTAFSMEELEAIEREFDEPEVSRVHALTRRQLVYGAEQSLYQCYRDGDVNA